MRLAFVCFATALVTPVVAIAADTVSNPAPGIKRTRRVTANQHINILEVDLCAPGVSVRATASNERQRTVSSFGALAGAEAAINGDFFSFSNYSTNGPSMHAGTAWGGSDHDYVSPVQFGPGQLALPAHGGTGGVAPWAREVVSGHPSLVVAGARRDNNGDPLCTARHPRTALGINADKTKMWLVVIDGRATNRIGMTCDEMSALFTSLGAYDAVNLDGGGSSSMWLANGGVVNYPSDGTQRVVANHLAVHAKGTGEAAHCPRPRFEATMSAAESAPIEMVAGEEAVVWLEFRNDGRAPWTLDNTRVGTQGPQDRPSMFFKQENWVAPNRPTAVDKPTQIGAVGRFTWAMVAPEVTETTTFEETFQLVQEGETWFGPTHTMTIVVHPRTGPTTPPGEDPGEDPGTDPTEDPAATDNGGCSTGGLPGALPVVALALVLLVMRRRRVTTSS